VSTCNTIVTVSRSNQNNIIVAPAIAPRLPSNNKVTEPMPVKFTVRVMPNPTSYYFTLELNSQSNEKFTITVIDVTGRMIEQKTDIPANSTL